MPLTKQIIEDIVRNVVKSELDTGLSGVKSDFIKIKSSLQVVHSRLDTVESKLDDLNTSVSNLAGQFQKFDDEQTLQTDLVSIHNDRIENLEKKVFGSIQTV